MNPETAILLAASATGLGFLWNIDRNVSNLRECVARLETTLNALARAVLRERHQPSPVRRRGSISAAAAREPFE